VRAFTRIVLIVVAAAAVLIGACIAIRASRSGDAPAARAEARRVPVVASAVRQMTFEDVLSVVGSIQAKDYALVSARMPGTLDAIMVDEGDRVQAGKTDLFRTDSLKLTKAVEVARQQLAVAESSLREQQASLEEIQAQHDLDKTNLQRYRELFERGAGTAYELDVQQSRFKQSAARVKHGRAMIDLRQAQCQQARFSVAMAAKDLADSVVEAPISGRVSERLREPGEMAAAGTPVLRIEDLSVVEVSAFLPEEAYARVQPGKTVVRVRVGEVDLGEQTVSYRSPTIRADLRTFEVKCVVKAPPAGVVPGRLAEMDVILARRQALGVPTESVKIRAGRTVVFVTDGERARMVALKTALATQGWVEVVEGDLSAGDAVVRVGQELLDDGTAVRVVKEGQ